jgi:hypothetical protein
VPSQQINAISLVPPLVDPVRPDYDDIHAMVARMLAGEAADSGDGSVGNEGSSAAAATQGSVPATPAAEADDSQATQPLEESTPAGQTASELGLVCQPV